MARNAEPAFSVAAIGLPQDDRQHQKGSPW